MSGPDKFADGFARWLLTGDESVWTESRVADARFLAQIQEVIGTAQHSLLHARDGADKNVDVIAARGFLSMALDALAAVQGEHK